MRSIILAASVLLLLPVSALATGLDVPDAVFRSRVDAVTCCLGYAGIDRQDRVVSGAGASTVQTLDDASFATMTLDYSSNSNSDRPFAFIKADILARTGGYFDDEFGDRHYINVGGSADGEIISFMEIFDTDNPTNRPVNVNVISKVVVSFSSGNIIDLQQIATWGLLIAPRDELDVPILSLTDTVTNSDDIEVHPGGSIVDIDREVIFQTNTLYAVTVSLYFGHGGIQKFPIQI